MGPPITALEEERRAMAQIELSRTGGTILSTRFQISIGLQLHGAKSYTSLNLVDIHEHVSQLTIDNSEAAHTNIAANPQFMEI